LGRRGGGRGERGREKKKVQGGKYFNGVTPKLQLTTIISFGKIRKRTKFKRILW